MGLIKKISRMSQVIKYEKELKQEERLILREDKEQTISK